MRKEITFEERKNIQLSMLQEIHDFCNSHNIRYTLAYGTLLGAIRHKGFIPWDDDVDIIMPLPDMIKLKNLFISDSIKFCDIDTEKHYDRVFPRFASKKTYAQYGLTSKTYGVNIDIYLLLSLPENEAERNQYFKRIDRLNEIRSFFIKWRSRLARRTPLPYILGHDWSIRRCYKAEVIDTPKYGTTPFYFVNSSPSNLNDLCTFDYDLFDEVVEVEFENHKFYATSHWHEFLKQRYGDYMKLPPEKDRHPYHGGKYYWNDKHGAK